MHEHLWDNNSAGLHASPHGKPLIGNPGAMPARGMPRRLSLGGRALSRKDSFLPRPPVLPIRHKARRLAFRRQHPICPGGRYARHGSAFAPLVDLEQHRSRSRHHPPPGVRREVLRGVHRSLRFPIRPGRRRVSAVGPRLRRLGRNPVRRARPPSRRHPPPRDGPLVVGLHDAR